MRLRNLVASILVLLLVMAVSVVAEEKEEDRTPEQVDVNKNRDVDKYVDEGKKHREEVINRYLEQTQPSEKKRNIGWAGFHGTVNRINRHNDYNDFAILESANITGAELSWLDQAFSFGAEFGFIFSERFSVSFGGEYWLPLGEKFSGTYTYSTSVGNVLTDDLKSEIQVYGISSGLGVYLINPPKVDAPSQSISVKAGGTVGYYWATWELWQAYENLNLSTALPTGSNAEFTGSAPGLSLNLSAEYPLNFWKMGLGADFSYLYLNFNNVSWYNGSEEVIVTYDGTENGRVDLGLSGFRMKFQIMRYFGW